MAGVSTDAEFTPGSVVWQRQLAKHSKLLISGVKEHIIQELNDESDDSEAGKAWADTIKALEAPEGPLGRLHTICRCKLEQESP